MGLDMYLHRKVRLDDCLTLVGEQGEEVEDVVKGGHYISDKQVSYWRKANEIHKYMFDKFGNGEDDCVDMSLGITDIQDLLKLCKRIKKEIKYGEGWVSDGNEYVYEPSKELLDAKMGAEVDPKMFGDRQKAVKSHAGNGADGKEYVVVDFYKKGKVIVSPDCKKLLPRETGFFFGDYDYDEDYEYDIDETIKQLEQVVKDHQKLVKAGIKEYDIDYTYHAWY